MENTLTRWAADDLACCPAEELKVCGKEEVNLGTENTGCEQAPLSTHPGTREWWRAGKGLRTHPGDRRLHVQGDPWD